MHVWNGTGIACEHWLGSPSPPPLRLSLPTLLLFFIASTLSSYLVPRMHCHPIHCPERDLFIQILNDQFDVHMQPSTSPPARVLFCTFIAPTLLLRTTTITTTTLTTTIDRVIIQHVTSTFTTITTTSTTTTPPPSPLPALAPISIVPSFTVPLLSQHPNAFLADMKCFIYVV